MTDSSVQIKIPEELITSLIQAEIVKALGNQAELVEAVVRTALAHKKDGWSRNSVFHETVCEMIRNEATKVFEGWIEANRERIRIAMIAELDRGKGKHIKQIVDGMISRMSKWDVSVNLNLPGEQS